ncbi:hypothetical protein GCM10027347_54280 [Larkinella harenae]
MRKSLVLAFFLLSTLVIGTSMAVQKQPVRIQIVIVQKTGQLWANMTFTNQSALPIYLNKLDIGMSQRLMNNLFVVKQKGQEVSYTGVMAKRRPPTLEDFVLLEPGKSVRTTIRLDPSYAFKPGKNRYSIQYRHYHGSPKDSSVLHELVSKLYYFDYAKPVIEP